MTQSEFEVYKSEIMAKATGANNHELRNLLGVIEMCIRETNPKYAEIAMTARGKINQMCAKKVLTLY